MAVQYESLINPLAILLSIPLSLVGVSGALWITGSSLMQPLAVAVVGGLSVSTFLTLLVVPSAYLILHGIMDGVKGAILNRRSGDQAVMAGAVAGD
jgi:multidrug efflux pump subunit AcrB